MSGEQKASRHVRKAIIPTAGKGTRLRPWTFASPKAMLPLVDSRGHIRPVLHWILTEAALAGIEQVALVVSAEQVEIFERYLSAVRAGGTNGLPDRVEMIVQPQPRGFGEAVLRARDWTEPDQAVAVMLGDHVYTHGAAGPCLRQLLEAYKAFGGAAMVGMQAVEAEKLAEVGVARGPVVSSSKNRVYLCEGLVEKPPQQLAEERLRTPGLGEGSFLAHAGLYVFSAEIFDVLAETSLSDRSGEVELTNAQAELLRRRRGDYRLLLLDGQPHDTGTAAAYAEAFAAFAAGPQH